MSEESPLTLETLIAVVLLIVFILCGPFFEKIHFHYAHESGVVMLLGIAVTFVMNAISPRASFASSLDFSSELFFTLILPPIIFGAGYNLRRKFFFKYLFYILLFGVIGTVINFCLVAPFTMMVNSSQGFQLTTKQDIFDEHGKVIEWKLKELEEEMSGEGEERRILSQYRILNEEVAAEGEKVEAKEEVAAEGENKEVKEVKETEENKENKENVPSHHSEKEPQPLEVITFETNEILLFASVISATDAVAALAFVKEESDPKLFPILFGEGVVNDAVCIVLYQIIKSFLDSGERKFFTLNS